MAALVLLAPALASAQEYTFITLAGSAGSGGSADGTGGEAHFFGPAGVAVDAVGNVYVADCYNHTIRKVTPEGVATTLAGLAGSAGSTDGPGEQARFNYPQGVAVDGAGNVFVADQLNAAIRVVTPDGMVSTLAGLAGNPGSADGPVGVAQFNWPAGVAVDGAGNAFVADCYNHTVRKVTPEGEVTTLAGFAGASGHADGPGEAARFNYPWSVAVDPAGNVLVSDTSNNTIRKVTPEGEATTLAGLPGVAGSSDGQGGAARFNQPFHIAADGDGCVYVADRDNHTIRKVTPGGLVTTLAGRAGDAGSADGTGRQALFNYPQGVASDDAGNLCVADVLNHSIRVGSACADAPTVDLLVGPVGERRQLDTSPQTASAWHWEMIQAPAESLAALSAANRRNPTFLPDVIGSYGFRLRATTAARHFSLRTLAFTAVPAPPAIVVPPISQTVVTGSTVGFRVSITNVAQGTVCQWYFSGAGALAGETNTSLKLTGVQPAQAGAYTVRVSNEYGSVTSVPGMLSVIDAVPTRTVAAVYLAGDPGAALHLEGADALEPGPAWQELATLTLASSPQLWLDLSDPLPPARFYRVWQANAPGVVPAVDVTPATGILLAGAPGSQVRVDYINQFGPTNAWVTLATVTLTNTSQVYVDATMFRQPVRHYRLVPLP